MKTPVRGYAARRRWLGLNPTVVIVIALIAIGSALWATGVVDPVGPFRQKRPSTHGLVAVPVSAVNIPAFTKITRDHLWNPKSGSFALIYLRPEQVSGDVVRNMAAIIGRVVDHDKPANYAFTEADFLAQGTRPGLVAGIPAGKRAMRVPVEKAPGLIGLQPGDRFDLVSALPIDANANQSLAGAGIYGKQLDLQARMTNWQKQATVRVIVQNGSIVEPMMTRQVPVANNTLTSGLVVRTKPVQEVVIAVSPGEVAHMAEALAVNAEISCVPRSGRPDDPRDSITPESYPWSPYGGSVQRPPSAPKADEVTGSTPAVPGAATFGAGFTPVETISGTKREIIATPVKK